VVTHLSERSLHGVSHGGIRHYDSGKFRAGQLTGPDAQLAKDALKKDEVAIREVAGREANVPASASGSMANTLIGPASLRSTVFGNQKRIQFELSLMRSKSFSSIKRQKRTH